MRISLFSCDVRSGWLFLLPFGQPLCVWYDEQLASCIELKE